MSIDDNLPCKRTGEEIGWSVYTLPWDIYPKRNKYPSTIELCSNSWTQMWTTHEQQRAQNRSELPRNVSREIVCHLSVILTTCAYIEARILHLRVKLSIELPNLCWCRNDKSLLSFTQNIAYLRLDLCFNDRQPFPSGNATWENGSSKYNLSICWVIMSRAL